MLPKRSTVMDLQGNDTTNFFKARLTSGITTPMPWYENEQTDDSKGIPPTSFKCEPSNLSFDEMKEAMVTAKCFVYSDGNCEDPMKL